MQDIAPFLLPSVVLAGLVTLLVGAFISRRNRWLLFGGLVLGFFPILLLLYQWHYFTKPNRRDRAAQRETVASRVALAGGWVAFERECRAFIETAPRYDGRPGGSWREAPAGYPALAALQPRKITVGSLRDGGSYLCLELFGIRSHGGRGIPFYSLAVSTREVQDITVLGFHRGRLHHVTNLVYEIR